MNFRKKWQEDADGDGRAGVAASLGLEIWQTWKALKDAGTKREKASAAVTGFSRVWGLVKGAKTRRGAGKGSDGVKTIVIAVLGAGLALSGPGRGQTTVAPNQMRSADFSGLSLTKPARTVGALPASCAVGEVVYLATGAGAAKLNVCSATNVWTALGGAVHGHALSDIAGVSGKQGDGALLMAFGGGGLASGDCAQFDAGGNIVSAGGPCGAGGAANAKVAFTGQTLVTMTHNRGTLDVLVSCYDSSNALLEPDRVTLVNTNTVQVAFAVAQSGTCVLNSSGGGSGTGGTPMPAVTSVFGRDGAVTAQAGDYTFAQIGGIASVTQGGTGAATVPLARANLLPGYSANAGKCLAVNAGGTDVEWATCGSGGGAYTAGFGIVLNGSEIGVAGSVPTFLTGVGSVADWNGGSKNVPAQSCQEKNFTLTGAREGDGVSAGWPAALPSGLSGLMYVGASDLVVVRLCNATAAPVGVADGLTFRATIVRSF